MQYFSGFSLCNEHIIFENLLTRFGIKPSHFDIVGFDYGAILALDYAYKRVSNNLRVNRLILISPLIYMKNIINIESNLKHLAYSPMDCFTNACNDDFNIDSINNNNSSLLGDKPNNTTLSLRGSGDSHNKAIHAKIDSITKQIYCDTNAFNNNLKSINQKMGCFANTRNGNVCNNKIDSINPYTHTISDIKIDKNKCINSYLQDSNAYMRKVYNDYEMLNDFFITYPIDELRKSINTLVQYKWDKLAKITQKIESMLIFLGKNDRMPHSNFALEFFSKYGCCISIKNINHYFAVT